MNIIYIFIKLTLEDIWPLYKLGKDLGLLSLANFNKKRISITTCTYDVLRDIISRFHMVGVVGWKVLV
jgi:hypothetical protein